MIHTLLPMCFSIVLFFFSFRLKRLIKSRWLPRITLIVATMTFLTSLAVSTGLPLMIAKRISPSLANTIIGEQHLVKAKQTKNLKEAQAAWAAFNKALHYDQHHYPHKQALLKSDQDNVDEAYKLLKSFSS